MILISAGSLLYTQVKHGNTKYLFIARTKSDQTMVGWWAQAFWGDLCILGFRVGVIVLGVGLGLV